VFRRRPEGPVLVEGAEGAAVPSAPFRGLQDDAQVLVGRQDGDGPVDLVETLLFRQEALGGPAEDLFVQALSDLGAGLGVNAGRRLIRFGEDSLRLFGG